MSSAWSQIKELHRQTTLGAKEGLAFRFFSRPLASFILYFIKDGRITPNQVTIASLIVGLAGSAVHTTVLEYWGLLLGAGLFMIAHMLDALDGQLARLRKAGSVIGMYFDFFIDELKAYFVFLAIAVRLYLIAREGGSVGFIDPMIERYGVNSILLVALAGIVGLAIGISCTQFVKRAEWKEAFPPGDGGGSPSPLARLIGLVEKAGKFVIDYPSYILLVCLVNHVEIYFALYAVVVCVYALRALSQISLRLWRVNPYQSAR
ncbi:MAG: CDP-alcohol phosphatidyltransferase family protein [Planctomycetota bacterium]